MVPPYRPFRNQESDANSLKRLTLGPDEYSHLTCISFGLATPMADHPF